MLPIEVASSSGVGEVLHSPPMGLRSEASTILSLLRTKRRALHHCSSHAIPQRIPVEDPDSSVQACNALAKPMVFCCLIIQELEEVGEAHSLGGKAQ